MSDGLFQLPYISSPLEEYHNKRIEELADYYMPKGIADLLKKVDNFLEEVKKKKEKKMTGIEKISLERLDQKVKHNHTIKSDYQQYPDFQLVSLVEAILSCNIDKAPDCFPDHMVNQILRKNYEQRLIIAGALIAAEIDRLNFEE